MGGIAILKPDHLGDLVLSIPAIRAIHKRYGRVTLFVSPGSLRLARYLFPDIDDIRTIALRHLARDGGKGIRAEDFAQELDRFDFLFCLRDDPAMRAIISHLRIGYVVASGGHLTHETAIQKRAVAATIGNYARSRHFARTPIFWRRPSRHVALCIAAGFPTNRWPLTYWLDLAHRLAARGLFLSLVGGPAEHNDIILLSKLLRRVAHRVVEGSDDFGGFLEAIDQAEVVVASDGGTAHICSLRKPICSVFGSSPWRRYAPFGRDNIVITRDEVCSPCVQFSTDMVNGCMTRECTALLKPAQVQRVLLSNGLDFSTVRGVRVERGVSHTYND